MSAIAAALKHMLASGMPHDAIVSAVAEMEAAMTSSTVALTTRQERNRRYYEKKKAEDNRLKASEKRLKTSELDASENRLKASENVLIQTPLARVRDNITTSVDNTQTVVDVSAGAHDQPLDWPEGDLVEVLVQQVASPRLDPAKSQGLLLTSGRLAAWRREGASWEFDVLPVVRAACAKARTPIGRWTYFDTAIAQSIADNRRALEIPEARAPHASSGKSIVERIADDNAEARRKAFELLDARQAQHG